MKKEYSRLYFAHILLNRLETHDRNSRELKFFRPKLFKKLYRYGNRDFVNDILVPHMDSLKIYYYKNENTISITKFKNVTSLFIEDSRLKITIDKQLEEFIVATPINKNREINDITNFNKLVVPEGDLSKATIDHFPSLIVQTNELKKKDKDSILLTYSKSNKRKTKVKNDELIIKINSGNNLDKLWNELILFYNDSKIELVQSKYNNREEK